VDGPTAGTTIIRSNFGSTQYHSRSDHFPQNSHVQPHWIFRNLQAFLSIYTYSVHNYGVQ
ncbi:hypothetical protein, partial [Lapidilactobacillus concavus]|uniref:hypothetical protein n=1 Tax=Lapidilactobacillus concavus TaxID=287844 RepID=UPI001C992BE8